MKLKDVALRAKPGDILGFTSFDWLGLGINALTFGLKCRKIGYSHVALVEDSKNYPEYPRLQGLLVYESTILCPNPCLCCGEMLKGVQFQRFYDKIRTYPGPVYWFRGNLPQNYSILYEYSVYLKEFLHTPYDLLGAFRARDFTLLEKIIYRKKDISRLYCSELVAAIYAKFFPSVKKNLVYSPNKLIKEFLELELIHKPVRVEI